MKYLSILLVFCFTLNAFAAAAPMKELEIAMDNYQYAMTVEWDQKDPAFKTQQLELLTSKMGELFKQGLTSEDVNVLIDARFKNSKVAEAAKLKLSLMGNKLTPSNVVDVLKNNSSDLYSQGASWTGTTEYIVWGGIVVAIVAIVLAYSNWKDENYVCTQTGMADYCTDRYDCDDYGCSFEYTECGSYSRCIKEERVGLN